MLNSRIKIKKLHKESRIPLFLPTSTPMSKISTADRLSDEAFYARAIAIYEGEGGPCKAEPDL